MYISLRVRRFLFLAAISVGLTATYPGHLAIGQEAVTTPDDRGPDTATGFDKLVAVLDQETSFDFFETPLEDVVAEIHDLHNVPVYLDIRALEDLSVDASEPISFEMEGVRLETALALMLKPLELTTTFYDNVLVITTKEAASAQPITRVYNVVDLIDRAQSTNDIDTLIEGILTSVQAASWAELGGSGGISSYQGNLVISQTYGVHVEIVALLKSLA